MILQPTIIQPLRAQSKIMKLRHRISLNDLIQDRDGKKSDIYIDMDRSKTLNTDERCINMKIVKNKKLVGLLIICIPKMSNIKEKKLTELLNDKIELIENEFFRITIESTTI